VTETLENSMLYLGWVLFLQVSLEKLHFCYRNKSETGKLVFWTKVLSIIINMELGKFIP